MASATTVEKYERTHSQEYLFAWYCSSNRKRCTGTRTRKHRNGTFSQLRALLMVKHTSTRRRHCLSCSLNYITVFFLHPPRGTVHPYRLQLSHSPHSTCWKTNSPGTAPSASGTATPAFSSSSPCYTDHIHSLSIRSSPSPLR